MRLNVPQGLSFPTGDPDGVKKFVIGSVVSFLGFLFLPALISAGYYLEALRMASEGEDRLLPDWADWGNYLVKGFWSFLIGLAFMSVPIIIGIVGVSGGFTAALSGAKYDSTGVAITGLGFAAICGMIAFGLACIIAFFVPMAQLRFARSGKAGDAFNFGGIISDIMKSPVDYFVSWAIPMGLGFLLNMAIGMTGFGLVLIPAMTFYVAMVNAHLLGQYYRAHLAEL